MHCLKLLAPSLFLAGLACAPAEAPEPEIDLEAERTALIEADRAWYQAYSASDDPVQVFVDQLTADAYLLAPETPLAQGKDEIRKIIQSLESMPGFSISWTATTAEVSSAADLGYTIGTYEMRMENPDGELVQVDGKYLTAWMKQDGNWMVTADVFNSSAPPSPVEEESSGS